MKDRGREDEKDFCTKGLWIWREREREREERREEENAVRRAVVGVVAMVVRGSGGGGGSSGGGGRREEDGVEDRLGICILHYNTYVPAVEYFQPCRAGRGFVSRGQNA